MKVKYAIGGREYEFDGTLRVEEAMILQDKANCGLNEADLALNKGNPYAIAAWMYILKRRAGEAIRWDDVLKLDIRTFSVIVDPDDVDDQEGEPGPAPDPTQQDGTTHEGGTSST